MAPFMNKFTKEGVPKDARSPGSPDSGVAFGQSMFSFLIIDFIDTGSLTDDDTLDGVATINYRTSTGHGVAVKLTLDDMNNMRRELAIARREGRFPATSASEHDTGIVFEDYMRLQALNNARGDAAPEDWNRMPNVVELMSSITREIRQRDEVRGEESYGANVNAHVENMMNGINAENHLYRIVQHAVHFAVNNGGNNEGATQAGVNMAALLDRIRGVVREMAGEGTHGVNNQNVDGVLEQVFSVIDDALNARVDHMDGQIKNMDGQINSLDSITNGQLNAIAAHTKAIDGYVNSMGTNLNSMGTLIHSTNNNINAMGSQLNLLQTIVNMLPQMITRVLEEILPQAIQGSIGPIMESIEAQLGGKKNVGKKSKGRKFFGSGFFGFFKKHGGNDGSGPGAGSAMV
ncbi:hypothetical protein F4779DRAFT_641819 [Xylariaceae sp. FL0662B]|nr:hypothetical protein F4779DRAFT_641819 [Xylariaceae sp. FL0662B]